MFRLRLVASALLRPYDTRAQQQMTPSRRVALNCVQSQRVQAALREWAESIVRAGGSAREQHCGGDMLLKNSNYAHRTEYVIKVFIYRGQHLKHFNYALCYAKFLIGLALR